MLHMQFSTFKIHFLSKLVLKKEDAFCPRCFSDRRGRWIMYLIALKNDRHLWMNRNQGRNSKCSSNINRRTKQISDTYTCRHAATYLFHFTITISWVTLASLLAYVCHTDSGFTCDKNQCMKTCSNTQSQGDRTRLIYSTHPHPKSRTHPTESSTKHTLWVNVVSPNIGNTLEKMRQSILNQHIMSSVLKTVTQSNKYAE